MMQNPIIEYTGCIKEESEVINREMARMQDSLRMIMHD
jgi:hypothetical protein